MYHELKEKFYAQFGRQAEYIFSAPGRTELGGNHTDHQHGRVLAAAVELDSRAAAAPNGQGFIRVLSEGYPLCQIDLKELSPRQEEEGSSAAIIRGLAAGLAGSGRSLRGFDAYVRSDVLPGSGLSSSAAFEVLMAAVMSHASGGLLPPEELARLGQYAENRYFGKPCGLMDQMACAVGGVIAIDFAQPSSPRLERIDFDFSSCGYALCIIDCGADHAELTAEYAAIPAELEGVCRFFGAERLRQVEEAQFYRHIPELRAAAGDRALLRAMHVFDENRRVEAMAQALRSGDFEKFLHLSAQSGRSSWMYLQNLIPSGSAAHQELALALALTERLLKGRGACRVHGGGFAGTLQAFVPLPELDSFQQGIESALGRACCRRLNIRPEGCVLVEEV